jgi:transposase
MLEKQNKDLRTRLENNRSKSELLLSSLKAEIAELKTQHNKKDSVIAMLQSEIEMLTKELKATKDMQAVAIEEKIKAAVAKATEPILDELGKAHDEILRLKSIINKDSSNSSKPPRTDGFKDIQNSREPSNRSRGGQPGHPGHRLGLPENLEELVRRSVVKQHVVDYTSGSEEYISRYVIDVEVVTTITEHRFAIGAKLPENMYNEVSYGENIKAMTVLLLNEGIIAEKRFSKMLEGLTCGAVSISPATLEKFRLQFANNLEKNGELEAIIDDLLNGEVMNTDDTTMRCSETVEYLQSGDFNVLEEKGRSFKSTIRTHSNETSTLYTVNPKKDMEGIKRDDILTRFFGILSHDHESKFYNYGTAHSTCGEHLLRDLKGLRDLEMISWAGDMRSHIAKMNKHKNSDLIAGKASCDSELLASFEAEYDRLITEGWVALSLMKEGSFGYDSLNAMLNRLTDYKGCYLLFIRNYKAPFTNNLAERDLRPEKTKEKVSILFRSWKGLKAHTRIRSFISTAKKRKLDLFDAITQVNSGISVLQ